MAGGARRRVPPLRWCAARGAGGQRKSARGRARRADARGPLQRPVPRLLPLLGRAAAGLRAVPCPDQGQGRAWRGLRQAQRHGGPPVREHGGAAGTPRALAARRRRHPYPRHDGRATAAAVRALRSAGVAASGCQGAVPASARADQAGAHRRVHRARHQPLQRAVEAHRRDGHGGGQRPSREGAVCRQRGGLPRAEPASALQRG